MDGRSKAELQVINGTRAAVELLNNLRLQYGYDRVVVKTPIVESKLRSGQPPARPLVIALNLSNILSIQLTIPTGYPVSNGLDVLLQANEADSPISLSLSTLQEISSEAATRILDARELLSLIISEIENAQQVSNKVVSVEDKGEQCPSPANADNAAILDDTTDTVTYFYHCRRCRYLLFTSLDLHDHSHEEREQCTSLFLEEAPGYVVTDEHYVFLQIVAGACIPSDEE
eukprot:gene30061-36305_t